ncbi:TonB-dependent siderophore receptor [Methylophaga sp.]|uniref:TonB-dependent siderophore receptor n=1 Tax=Methylophaga sp. TaxID=2024840 RepID=UPI0027207380|nr:TonB-dependent receptor [Methylophaga sp.]MDO8826858.1 TonB-dependent receptor [Methylophaga sp.]
MRSYLRAAGYAGALNILVGLTSGAAFAEDVVELDTVVTEDTVEDIGLIFTDPVDSIFGFNKTIEETPRSVSTISAETMSRYGMTNLNDLVILAPGTFTQSFFGVAGSLDVRGTPGETYFRGMKRLDNPGNYPTPIGASDRIDIVRGPASPIMGPSKIGGYLNFVPKSSRAETGQYLDKDTGQLSITTGSWDKKIMTGEIGGPVDLGDRNAGYYVYFEQENSGSYYENTETDQSIFQASFNTELSDTTRIEFGGMYHNFEGNQVAGWNRVTQDLIDNGTYITGQAQSLDTNGDGSISHDEYNAVFGGINTWLGNNPGSLTDATVNPAFNLENPGTAKLKRSQVLVAEDDKLTNEDYLLYFDLEHDFNEKLSLTNKVFYETYESLSENAYGFAQFHDSSVFEEKVILSYVNQGERVKSSYQLSPSVRYTKFKHGDDFTHEFFDRRDLTGPSTARDRRLLATRTGQDYDNYDDGYYIDYGLAFLADYEFDFGLGLLAGIREDYIKAKSKTPEGILWTSDGSTSAAQSESGSSNGTSWTLSANYKTDYGLTPYVTFSEQFTVVAGQGSELTASNIAADAFTDTSELQEVGIKGNFLDGRLFMALSHYKQKRTDTNSQSIVTNSTSETKGTEFEFRFLATDQLSFTGAFTHLKVLNLTTKENNGQFSFYGADDLTGVTDPSLIYGGQYIGTPTGSNYKQGLPENSYSLSAAYDFKNGFVSTLSYFHADSVYSGHSQAVKLPAYDLFNAGLSYNTKKWGISAMVKNLTNEKYFRSNFPDLFGSQIVLPELPRNYSITATYKF